MASIRRVSALIMAMPFLVGGWIGGTTAASASDDFGFATGDVLTQFPGKAELAPGETITIQLSTDEGFDCETWTYRIVGGKKLRTKVTVESVSDAEGKVCGSDGARRFVVALEEDVAKSGRVVLKFKLRADSGKGRKVQSVNLRISASETDDAAADASPDDSPPGKRGQDSDSSKDDCSDDSPDEDDKSDEDGSDS